MDAISLEYCCLLAIRENLELISKICKKNSYIVPSSVGESIYEFCLTDNEPFSNEELSFFTNDIVKLTTISLWQEKYIEGISFDFLQNQPIKKLHLIDFESMPNLYIYSLIENLSLHYCNFNLDDFIRLKNHVLKCKHLKSFSIVFDDRTSSEGCNEIFLGLKASASNLVKLHFINYEFSEIQSFHLGELLANCSKLEKVCLQSCFGGKITKNVFVGLKSSCSSLKKIQFTNCEIQEEESQSFNSLLKSCTNLQEVDLSQSKYKLKFEDICKSLASSSSTLLKLNFDWCELDEENCYWVTYLVEKCTQLEDINFGFISIFGDEYKNICNGLKNSSSSLLNINVWRCDLSERQSVWLGDLLSNCTSLQTIILDGNYNLNIIGCQAICKGLKYSSSLLKIDFSWCNLNEEQILCLSELFTECTFLEKVLLDGNTFSLRAFEKICKGLLSSSLSLQLISLFGCQLSTESRFCFNDLLIKCSLLTAINLGETGQFARYFTEDQGKFIMKELEE